MKLTKEKLYQLINEEYKKGDWFAPLFQKVQGLNSEIDKIQGAMDNLEKKIEDGFVLDDASPQVERKAQAIYDQTFEEYDKSMASIDAELDELMDNAQAYMQKRGIKRFGGITTSLIKKKLEVFRTYPKYANAYFNALEKNNFPTSDRIIARVKKQLGMLMKNQKDRLQQQYSHFEKMSAMDKEVEDAETRLQTAKGRK